MKIPYETYFKGPLALIEKHLKKALRERERQPRVIHQAMQYAVFTGGKRFRPVLTLSVCAACGGKHQTAVLPAVAIEMIHTYSLVHDDLPALDNDDLRRGNPTCHRKFGEANAILAGDALLTMAFEILAGIRPAATALRLVREVATAAGVHGMIGGQVADLAGESRKKSLKEHQFISRCKTGQLIRVSALAGALAAAAPPRQLRAAARYGECLGFAFQLVDDILDEDGFCEVMSVRAVVRKALGLIREAREIAGRFAGKAAALVFLADFLEARIPLDARRG